mmetsp:Transcript_15777/g.23226  ORF Transcript_15777/g.23226 Transcript_15777/m.23226 type:complete len:232 (-) Transcript_15777:48-743(-)|eukprot:CAMPEP_0194211052 /NCGR_PEP_ID=MMETSP0156-20130528/9256_1 /TAXON_ID=33649 /ORGANISM="Thalassionema nitzschioides, Strain L26-B" /LENGTH=231 /DNA_ID=CAMNT_0038938477 /DNA_START=49 /DNA_END=744 /DNA_ORIENTATION=+
MASEMRKRGTATATPEAADKIKNKDDLESADNSSPSDKEEAKTDKVTIVLLVILVFLLFYNFIVPRASKIRHKRAMEHQFKVVADAIQEQQNSLAKQYESLSMQFSSLSGSSGATAAVQQSDHESAIKMFETNHEKHAEEIALLKADLKKKDHHSELIEDQLKELREQMQKIQAKMGFDHASTFCEECIGHFGSLIVTCGARRDYLMRAYNTPKDIATEGVMKLEPKCQKK